MIYGVVILGAGASARMGRPKLLLPWPRAGTILSHLVSQWERLQAAQVAVVSGPPPHPVWQALESGPGLAVNRIINADPAQGMFSSIQTAASWPGWKPELTHLVLALGDQPLIQERTLKALLAAGLEWPYDVIQPALNARAKHPVIFPRSVWDALRRTTAATLRDFLAQLPKRRTVEVVDEFLDLDLDTPNDYQKALATFDSTESNVSG